jgi:hypothetical protein
MPLFTVRERLAFLPTQRSEKIAMALLVLAHVAAQGVTVSDVEKHLWVMLLAKLIREAIATD